MSFEYKPIGLEGPAFRLLRLLKGNNDPLQCELFESKLAPPQDVEDYAALSYTWGSNSRPCEITINGSKMRVTKNAYLALRDLRDRERDRVLWIDALCINQNDNKERGQQVQQMGSIYRKAERVVIWLGESSYDTDYVMHHMKKLEKEGIKHASNGREILDKEWVDIWSEVVHDLDTDQIGLLLEGFWSLLHRNWFKRVWIIQETANARDAEIVCGGKFVLASIFARTVSLLKITPDPHCQPILDIMPGHHRNRSWWAEKPDLYTMLDKFRNSEATDPRDNIYALLGISSDASDTSLLEANYEKSLPDVIFDTTSFLLNFNKSDSPICRFFDWELSKFLSNLNSLANIVLKSAMDNECEPAVRLLVVRDDVKLNETKSSGETPLSWAAKGGREAVVKLLLETGKVDVNKTDLYKERTALSYAAEGGHEAVVRLLLETVGVDVENKDTFGQTVLSHAARGGYEAVAKLLLKTGKVDANSMDGYDRTVLSYTAELGHEAVVKLLLETGKVDVDSTDEEGRTALLYAAKGGHEAVVKLLLETGKVDVDSTDDYGRTPMLYAAIRGHKAVVKLLLETGKVDVNETDLDDLRTALSYAAEGGHEALVRFLLGIDEVDVDSKDEEGRTAVSYAAEGEHEAVVKLLLKTANVDPDSTDVYERTALSYAAEGEHEWL
jgi:ankyrin repeat protein